MGYHHGKRFSHFHNRLIASALGNEITRVRTSTPFAEITARHSQQARCGIPGPLCSLAPRLQSRAVHVSLGPRHVAQSLFPIFGQNLRFANVVWILLLLGNKGCVKSFDWPLSLCVLKFESAND